MRSVDVHATQVKDEAENQISELRAVVGHGIRIRVNLQIISKLMSDGNDREVKTFVFFLDK